VEETWVPEENHRPAVTHWQTWSHNVVLSTPRLYNPASDIRQYVNINVNIFNSFSSYMKKTAEFQKYIYGSTIKSCSHFVRVFRCMKLLQIAFSGINLKIINILKIQV
jgi:hypothetical protein